MVHTLNLIGVLFALMGCSSSSVLDGEVVSSKDRGQGITEYLVQTQNNKIPFFKMRTNKNNFYRGSKVALELP